MCPDGDDGDDEFDSDLDSQQDDDESNRDDTELPDRMVEEWVSVRIGGRLAGKIRKSKVSRRKNNLKRSSPKSYYFGLIPKFKTPLKHGNH